MMEKQGNATLLNTSHHITSLQSDGHCIWGHNINNIKKPLCSQSWPSNCEKSAANILFCEQPSQGSGAGGTHLNIIMKCTSIWHRWKFNSFKYMGLKIIKDKQLNKVTIHSFPFISLCRHCPFLSIYICIFERRIAKGKTDPEIGCFSLEKE